MMNSLRQIRTSFAIDMPAKASLAESEDY